MAALAVAAVLAPGAFAHSVLIGTQPGNDVVVQQSPDEVLLEFDEPVDASLGSVRVFDADGRQVDRGDVEQPEATEVAVGIDDELAPGTYTVAWRAVSADSDPISGAFVFHVLERGATLSTVSIDALTGTPQVVEVLYTASRFFELALLLAAVGGTFALGLVLPAAGWRLRRTLYGVLAGLAGGLALAAAANIVLHGASAVGLGLGDALSWHLLRMVLGTDYGEVMVVQAGLAVSLALTAMTQRNTGGRESDPVTTLSLVLAGSLVLTPSFSGHARTAGGIGLLSDILHVAAAAIWTGGLVFLLVALLAAEAERWLLAVTAVPRFSNLAVGSVAALLVAGITSAYLQVRTWSALWETRYGLLILAKIVLVTLLVAIGAYNNRCAVPKLRRRIASRLEQRRFLGALAAELALMIAIVAVTAVLIEAPPARVERLAAGASGGLHGTGTASTGDVFAGEVVLGDLDAEVTVDPGEPGQNAITVAFADPDAAADITEVAVAASLPSQEIGPLVLTADPDPAAPGTYVVVSASLSIAGTWTLRIEALRGEFDLLTETIEVPIGT
jgi:copper transport protein